MSDMLFQEAVKAANDLPSSLSIKDKSRLYGLYKTVTMGAKPDKERPGMFNVTDRTKWDAWHAAGVNGTKSRDAAIEEYVTLVEELSGKKIAPTAAPMPQSSAAAAPSPQADTPPPSRLMYSQANSLKLFPSSNGAAAKLLLEKFNNEVRELSHYVSEDQLKEILHRVTEEAKGKAATARDRLESSAADVGLTYDFLSAEYLKRLAFCLVFLMISGYMNALSSAIAGYRNPQIKITAPQWATKHTTLPDLGHDFVAFVMTRLTGEDYIPIYEIPDYFVSIMGSAMLFFVFIHPRRFMILRRLFFVFSVLNVLRSCTVAMTSLPDASPKCAAQFGNTDYKERSPQVALVKSLQRAFLLVIQPGQHITCGDMVFSGHCTFITLCFMVFHHYCRDGAFAGKMGKLIRFVVFVAWACGVFSIIGTKLHYSLDVFLAILLTTSAFRGYHHAIEHDRLKEQYFLLKWLEAEEIGAIDSKAYEKVEKNQKKNN